MLDLATDITDKTDGLAQEDRLFRTADGFVIKVKCVLNPPDPRTPDHVAYVTLSGSVCGADGKALKRRDGSLAVWELKRSHVFMAHGDDDPMASLQESRLKCVLDTIRAEKARQAITDHVEGVTPGMVTAAAFQQKREAAGL